MNITQRKPFSPSEILLEEFMQPLQLNEAHLAQLLKCPVQQVTDLLHDQQAINPDMAIRLSRLFNTSAEYWLNLQQKTDLWSALHDPQKHQEYNQIEPLSVA